MPDGIDLKRIIDLDPETTVTNDDYTIVDSATGGAKKFALGQALNDLKEDYDDIDDRVTALEGGGSGSGLTENIKAALLQMARKVAYIDADGQDYYDDLYDALYTVTAISVNPTTVTLQTIGGTQQLTATTTPSGASVSWASSNTAVATVDSNGLVTSVGYGSATITATAGQLSATCAVVVAQATLTSIDAVYTQSGTVYTTDSLDSLKDDLVVTAHWSNGTTSTVASADYTLSGTLAEGTSTVTVTYGGQTDTFSVTVTHPSTDPVITDHGYYFNINGALVANENYCVTDYYAIPYTGELPFTLRVYIHYTSQDGVTPYLLVYDANKNKTNQYKMNYVNEEKDLAWKTVAPSAYFRTSLLEDGSYSYAYVVETGEVVFAGSNSPYYGMDNISEANS